MVFKPDLTPDLTPDFSLDLTPDFTPDLTPATLIVFSLVGLVVFLFLLHSCEVRKRLHGQRTGIGIGIASGRGVTGKAGKQCGGAAQRRAGASGVGHPRAEPFARAGDLVLRGDE
ncbi:MAG: hypothetical protein ACC655_05335, partial [Rhodothermia bacterium]